MRPRSKKRAKAPRKYKITLYDKKRRQAISPTRLWAQLTEAARKKLENAGYDQHSWDNNCREVVHVNQYDLIHTGGGSSVKEGNKTVAYAKRFRESYRKMQIDDEDAFARASSNE